MVLSRESMVWLLLVVVVDVSRRWCESILKTQCSVGRGKFGQDNSSQSVVEYSGGFVVLVLLVLLL
jgi:hypothetical protein